MVSHNKALMVIGCAFSLFLTGLYKFPSLAVDLFGPLPAVEALGWEVDPRRAERLRDRVMTIVLTKNTEMKTRVAWMAIRGQHSLLQAARFRELDENNRFARRLHRAHPNDAVVLCREVMNWARVIADDGEKSKVEPGLCQLEAELHDIEMQPGPVTLPSASPAFAGLRGEPLPMH